MFKVNNKDIRMAPTYFTHCSSVSIANFEQVNAGWEKVAVFQKCRNYINSQVTVLQFRKITKDFSFVGFQIG